MEGHSRVVALAVLNRTPKRLDVETDLIGGGLKAGLAFGYRSEQDFYVLMLVEGGEAWIVHRDGDEWERVLTRRVSVDATRNSVALARDGKNVTLFVNGKELHTMEAPGRVGLACENCRVRFYIKRPTEEP